MLLQFCMIICPVSHICDGQKTCFPTMLQTSFFAQEIISLKLSKTLNFRKMRQFLNRAVINGLKDGAVLKIQLFLRSRGQRATRTSSYNFFSFIILQSRGQRTTRTSSYNSFSFIISRSSSYNSFSC